MAHTAATDLLAPEFLAQLERLELVSRKVLQGRMKGERRSKRKGQSVEFADYRNYVPGDDLRFVDWNTYARLDRLFIKLFQEEEDLHLYCLVDASGSMDFGEPTKLAYARQVAAALGFVGLIHSDRVVVETLQQPLKQRSPSLRGRGSVWRLLELAGGLEASDSTVSLTEGIKNFCVRHPGKGICVLVSDLFEKEGYQAGLRMLAARGMDVYVIHTLAPEDLEPDLDGDLRLIDCEDGDVAEITANPMVLERYRQTVAAFLAEVQQFCTRRGMAYLTCRTDAPLEGLLTNYLRSRGLLR